MSDVVLQSQRVFPKKALDRGFKFSFNEFGDAISDLLKRSE
jgi:NAD dependent epimerase/dehydratase family enzyme